MQRYFLIVLIVLFTFSLLAACSTAEQPLTVAEMLDLGEKYLLEYDYEQALAQFLGVIEIEPRNPRGYTGAAESYIGLGKPDDAIEILRRGLTVLPDEQSIIDMLDSLTYVAHVHTWQDATCENPKTCIECGETEGETLPHTWIDADFHNPQICTVCGATLGDPLTPEFETYGYPVNAMLDVRYPYRTMDCDCTMIINGEAMFTDFRVVDSLHGVDAPDGYEFQIVTMVLTYDFGGGEPPESGVAYDWFYMDYYYGDFSDVFVYDMYDFDTENWNHFWNNGELTGDGTNDSPVLGIAENVYDYDLHDAWVERTGDAYIMPIEIISLVPIGYDGFVITLVDVSSAYAQGGYDEDDEPDIDWLEGALIYKAG